MSREELARVRGVVKRFGDCVSVSDVSCAFASGEIHAVCGENGAGKSSLLKVVCGILPPDAGEVWLMGRPLTPHTAAEAIARGAAMVLQHFALVPVFTVLENIVLGSEPTSSFGMLEMAKARARAEALTRELGMALPLDAKVAELGVGDRQRLEIVRALYRDARLLVLDEPTAVLTRAEATVLYAMLKGLASRGRGIVVVTHKMDEVAAFADRVTVLRRGEVVLSCALDRTGDVPAQVAAVTKAIMGTSAVTPGRSAEHEETGEVVLEIRGATAARALEGLSLTVRAGEIVGLAGVEGNGQRELVRAIAGDIALDAGSVRVTGGPAAVIREDRQVEGLVLDASLEDNLLLGELARFTRAFGVLDGSRVREEAAARLLASGANGTPSQPARTLSGGNQQKLVVARALARLAQHDAGPAGAHVLVAAQPTRGVDLAAAAAIHDAIRAAAGKGAGVLVVSADLDELRALASRILVIARGAIVAELPSTATDEELGRPMLGLENVTGSAADRAAADGAKA